MGDRLTNEQIREFERLLEIKNDINLRHMHTIMGEQGTVTVMEGDKKKHVMRKGEYTSDEHSSKGLKVTFQDNNFNDDDDLSNYDDDTERVAVMS